MITKTTSVRVYMYSLHIHSYDQGYDYKNHFSESIYVFAAHTQLWSRLWVQNLLQWEYICIRCTYTAMIKVMITKTTSVRVYMYSLHIHSYDQGYEYKIYFSESIYVFAAHTQLWSRLWLQKPLQWEYICIRCTYTAMIKVMITKTTSVRVYMYSLHIHSYDQGYDYKNHFSESIYVFAAHTQLWSRLWVQKPLQWEYICIRCTYTAMIKVMSTKTTSVRVYMYSLHIHSYDQGYEYKIYFSESIWFAAQKPLQWEYMYSLHIHSYDQRYDQNLLQWEYICIRCTYTAMIKVMITKTTSVRVYMYSLHIHSYDQGYEYKIYFSESIYVFAAHTQLWSRLWLQKPLQWEYICIRCTYTAMIKVMSTKSTSVRVYMYSLHIHSYDQGYDYKNHFSESIYVFAAHTQLWSRLWLQKPLQWEYICIRCTYNSYDQGYDYKNHFSESIYVFAAHTQLWSRLWLQNLLQWEYICIRCTYTAMIKVMITKNHFSESICVFAAHTQLWSRLYIQWEYICIRCTYTAMIKVMITKTTSVRVYMYSLHIHSYDQGYDYKKLLQWEYICIRCTYTAMIKVMITKTTSVRVYMYSLHIHSYDQGYDYKNHFSESIYVFAAHTQLWSRLWVQNLLQWEYICIRCTYTAMIKVMITKTTSVRVYMYSLHIHSYDQAYEYKIYFSESIYVFAAHTQLWSRLWLQGYDYNKPLQWEYICIRIRCDIHSYDQGYEYKIYFSESIYVFAAHTQLWSRLWVQKPLQWEYICIRCTYTAMIKVMSTKSTSVRVYMYSLHIQSYDQGYEYKIYFSESIYVFAAHTQLWSRLWVQNLLQWEYICIRCTYKAMIKVMITKTTSVRVYMYSLHIHSYDQGYEYKIYFSESIYVFAAHTQLWSRLWLVKICIRCTYTSVRVYMYSLHIHSYDQGYDYKKPLQWEYICIRCTYTPTRLAMIKVMITKTTSVRVYMYSLHIHSYDQGYEYKIYFSESIYVFAAHTQLWSRLWLQKPLQWEYICIRCTYTAMIKVMSTKSTSVRVYMYSLHIHSYDQGYDYKNHFSESICVFSAHTQLWSRLWVQNLLQWEYICIRCTYTAMIKVMITSKTTSVRVYMYSLHIHSYDQGYDYKIYFTESINVFAAHTQLWSRFITHHHHSGCFSLPKEEPLSTCLPQLP